MLFTQPISFTQGSNIFLHPNLKTVKIIMKTDFTRLLRRSIQRQLIKQDLLFVERSKPAFSISTLANTHTEHTPINRCAVLNTHN